MKVETLLHKAAIVLGAALLIALGVHIYSPGDTENMLITGDFPAFYAAAKIVEDDPSELYNFHLQHKIENETWPELNGQFLAYAYPPYTVPFLLPLAKFSPDTAKLIFVTVNILAYLIALFLLSKVFHGRKKEFISLSIILTATPPIFSSLLGAQNSGITLLGLSCFYVGLRNRNTLIGQIGAGFGASFMLYKPQFAILPFLTLLILGTKVTWITSALLGALFFALGASILGLDWFPEWLEAATSFGFLNFGINSHHMISINGTLYSIIRLFGVEISTLKTIMSYCDILILALVAFLFFTLIKQREQFLQSETTRDITIAIIALVNPILAPQTLYYDLTIIIPAVYLLWRGKKLGMKLLFLGVALSYLFFFLRSIELPSLYGIGAIIGAGLFLMNIRKISNGSHLDQS